VTVVERAYLGEFWDYVVVPVGGTMRLKVTTPPLAVHEVGETAWLGIDPRQITPIS
jgi:iron(III) transport system ATP-binding protein